MANTWSHMFSLLANPVCLYPWESTGSLWTSDWMVRVHCKSSLCCFPIINQMLFLEIADPSEFYANSWCPLLNSRGKGEHMSMVSSILRQFCRLTTARMLRGGCTAEQLSVLLQCVKVSVVCFRIPSQVYYQTFIYVICFLFYAAPNCKHATSNFPSSSSFKPSLFSLECPQTHLDTLRRCRLCAPLESD